MSDMVERVARALAPLSWAALGLADTLAHKNRRTASLRHARAAIAAMREPTEEMADKGENILVCGALPADIEISPSAAWAKAKSCWRNMIDAALSSPGRSSSDAGG